MENTVVRFLEKPKLKNPILIEGLPGVGNVGKIAAEHLVEEAKGKKFAEIISKFFPPQVLVLEDGIIKQVNNELYYIKDKQDIIVLVGDFQCLTGQGQYELVDKILDIMEEFKVKKIFTLGGYGIGRMVKSPKVLGATTSKKLTEEMRGYGVVFSRSEPSSGIIGASGLLLGLGKLRGAEGVCLMGQTSGYLADPNAAEAVLKVLTKILGTKIDFSKLEKRAKQVERIAAQLKEAKRRARVEAEEGTTYIR